MSHDAEVTRLETEVAALEAEVAPTWQPARRHGLLRRARRQRSRRRVFFPYTLYRLCLPLSFTLSAPLGSGYRMLAASPVAARRPRVRLCRTSLLGQVATPTQPPPPGRRAASPARPPREQRR
jgi:hypothetical protein